MPHYFFDLTDNETVHDFKGKQLANIQLARQHAIGIARECDLPQGGGPAAAASKA